MERQAPFETGSARRRPHGPRGRRPDVVPRGPLPELPGTGLRTVRLTPRGFARARGGHPWVYRGDLDEVPDELEGGETVAVAGPHAEFAGVGLYSSSSLLAVRIFHRRPEAPDEAFWVERLDAALALRRDVLGDPPACRLVYGESDGLPSFIADRYGDVLVVQVLSQAAERLAPAWIAHLAERLRPLGVLARNDGRVRELEGLPREVRVLEGDVPDEVEVDLEGVRLAVDLRGGQKTGAFLDQRENYRAAAAFAHGRVLDAFTYQGGFALHAARRAASVEAVEISPEALRRGEGNARRNGIENVRFVEGNAFDRLHELDAAGERFDMVVLDPPAFARSRSSLDAGLRGYKEINFRAMRILAPGGILVTCSCSHHVSEELFLNVLREAAVDAARTCQILERRGQSRDHPVLVTCPETAYLKCVIARVP
jgi:23S rRNA (cytosine1962-C5)-methyltransferase